MNTYNIKILEVMLKMFLYFLFYVNLKERKETLQILG